MSQKEYLDTFVAMISLRGLISHTVKSYKTYISAYPVLPKKALVPEISTKKASNHCD